MTKRPRRPINGWILVAGMAAFLVAGCGQSGPELGEVTGTVTFDEKPVSGAKLEFQPVRPGAPSFATTDEQGRYELIYSLGSNGAMVGRHTVRIETYRQLSGGGEIPEKLPSWYNTATILVDYEVKPGAQVIDFPLSSKRPAK